MTNYDKNTSDPDLTAEDLTDLDTVIDSKTFTTSLGTRAEDINVVGDAFISEYSANGPEELLPGGVYDTLDMKIFDLKGQIVMRKKISLENNLINISSLKQGIYIIKAEGNDSLFQQKLMVH